MAVSIAYTDTAQFTDFASSPQSDTIDIGLAASDRLVFVAFFNVDGNGSSKYVNGVTIGGVTASRVDDAYISAGAVVELTIYWALVPSGTTATLSVSFSSAPTDSSMDAIVYRVTGADTTSPVADADSDSTGASPSAAITIPDDGALLAVSAAYRVGSVTFTGWTNAIVDQSSSNAVSGVVQMQAQTALSSTPGTPTVTAEWGAGTDFFLSLVAIQPGAPAYSLLFNQQLRY